MTAPTTDAGQALLTAANGAGNLPAWKVERALAAIEAEAVAAERWRLRAAVMAFETLTVDGGTYAGPWVRLSDVLAALDGEADR